MKILNFFQRKHAPNPLDKYGVNYRLSYESMGVYGVLLLTKGDQKFFEIDIDFLVSVTRGARRPANRRSVIRCVDELVEQGIARTSFDAKGEKTYFLVDIIDGNQ